MGYAKLVFSTTTTSEQLLNDITGVVSGTITDKSQLQHCNTTTSEIVNVLGENWTVISNNQYRKGLSSPCLTEGKTKYAILSSHGGSNFGSAVLGTSNSAIFLNSAAYIAPGTPLSATGETWISIGGSSAIYTRTNSVGFTSGSPTQIHIGWSSRYIFILGSAPQGGEVTFRMVTEFPENELTLYNGAAPYACLSKYYSGVSLNGLTGITVNNTSDTDSINVLNQFVPTLNTTVPVYAFTSSTGDGSFNTVFGAAANIAPSISSSGAPAYYFTPLWFSGTKVGIPIINFSTLSNVYATDALVGNLGDSVLVGPDEYVVLPWGGQFGSTTKSVAMVILKK